MADDTLSSKAPRIAIKFGAPSSSSSSSKPTNGTRHKATVLGKRPRSHALNPDSESEDDEPAGRHEKVTAFGINGAEDEKARRDARLARNTPAQVVIPSLSNRDWKADKRARKHGRAVLPHEVEGQFGNAPAKETEPADQDKDVKWGLVLAQVAPADAAPKDSDGPDNGNTKTSEAAGTEEGGTGGEVRTADEDAVDALLGKDRRKNKLVITSLAEEDEALQRSYEVVGEVSTIEEYEQIPDGEFGAAMLRGMGWDGKPDGVKAKEVKRRQNLLGLGAKEDEEIRKADLARKHGHRERRPRLDEYKREKEKERQQREDRFAGSHKSERDHDRGHHSRRHDDRDRDRDRHHDRDRGSHRHHDRDSRR